MYNYLIWKPFLQKNINSELIFFCNSPADCQKPPLAVILSANKILNFMKKILLNKINEEKIMQEQKYNERMS